MSFVAGLDGCRKGWVCVLLDAATGRPESASILAAFSDIIARDDIIQIAVDIPIGIPHFIERGGRGCDQALRAKLGARQSSVFSVPAREAVVADDYVRSCEIAYARSDPPRRVSKQCFHIFPKIREVDALMSPDTQRRVVECHPEGAFWAMNGKTSLTEPKKLKSKPYAPGLALRRGLLLSAGFPAEFIEQSHFRRSEAGEDDFLDACACAWTARRVLQGKARRFPDQPLIDPKGLRMEIWA